MTGEGLSGSFSMALYPYGDKEKLLADEEEFLRENIQYVL